MEGETSGVARRFAAIIIMIGMLASGLAAAAALAGWSQLSVQICGVALLLGVVILILGGVLVSATKTSDEGVEGDDT